MKRLLLAVIALSLPLRAAGTGISPSPQPPEPLPIACAEEQAQRTNPAASPSKTQPAAEERETPLPWEGPLPQAIRLPHGKDITETSDFPELEVPPPSIEGALFSRKPLPAYVNPKNGHLVIEYTLPKLSRGGVNTLMIESCSLSPDGTELTIHRQRLYAPAAEKAQTHFVYKLKTSIPYRFIRDRHLYVFNVENAVIVSCNVFCIKNDRDKPTWKRCIYPAREWAYGIMSHL